MYTKNMPRAIKIKYLCAEKQGLFTDLLCPFCGKSNDINFREEKIKMDSLRYFCDFCDNGEDKLGTDIVEQSAFEYVHEHPYSLLSILYYIFVNKNKFT